MALNNVTVGDPHAVAHNAERAAINKNETDIANHVANSGIHKNYDAPVNNLTSAINAHVNDVDDAHDASAISLVPNGVLGASNVQVAIDLVGRNTVRGTAADINSLFGSTNLGTWVTTDQSWGTFPPVPSAWGILIVRPNAVDTTTVQTFVKTAGESIWTRNYYNGSWTAWKRIDTPDTGWRNVTGDMLPETLHPENAGKLRVRRIGDRVVVRFSNLRLTPGNGVLQLWTPPSGFVCSGRVMGAIADINNLMSLNQIGIWEGPATWLGRLPNFAGSAFSGIRPSAPIHGEIAWTTDQAFPTTLPGTPA